ncbi:predicted protein [Plenodomus lingam JN3]|uniref:Predicted protein n=1 Tax=Leptosphaeria maculans (strain JN3 / isolate v23.1.3 / race Av1-4-5-6-7-8) TaxID=985895 RepID=E4ZN65_LEPMJ|nr:predicted protein [Plenodomus lingam JN3]CBX92924.1 predicted protein [Plenodomus lingam JN3]
MRRSILTLEFAGNIITIRKIMKIAMKPLWKASLSLRKVNARTFHKNSRR